MRFNITATGTRPLLMHSDRGVNPFDPLVKEKKKLTDKKTKKTDDDILEIARIDWELGMYFEDGVGPVMPAGNIHSAIQKAAGLVRQGKDIERGVQLMGDLAVPLLYDGPRTVGGLWGKGVGVSPFVDYRAVGQGQVRVMRCRPIFRRWGFEFEAEIDTTILDPEAFVGHVTRAGELLGIGDFRKLYGRFKIAVSQ